MAMSVGGVGRGETDSTSVRRSVFPNPNRAGARPDRTKATFSN